MRPRLLPVLLAASCALAAWGGAKKQAEPAPPDLAPPPTAQQRLSESPADQLPPSWSSSRGGPGPGR